ncbi:HAD family hydrolase [Campylobacter sp. RM16188]|uniref:HAD family hydrolase n=2 Tax=unclassified Campylobacter TaxID=2593542 RepID=UPI0015548C23|nr:HAD family hydrolase [Campylobacter sp. RM16188]
MAKQNKIKAAIVYDFDGTLAQGNIQENSFLPSIGTSKDSFWKEVKQIAKANEMDEILAYMYLMISKASLNKAKYDKNSIRAHGESVVLFNGAEEYFGKINEYAKSKNIELEHYIISSGTKEMIEGTSIAKNFKYIYASSYFYDQHDIPIWPAMAINYTTKTQFLFRINKGIDNAWDNSLINKYVDEEQREIPFSRMIYIGDGETDIPAMKMVNYQGGFSIAVYPPNKRNAKFKAEELIKYKRATYAAEADYREDKKIFKILKSILDHIYALQQIEKYKKI